jgi:hypothetical protein
MNIGILGTGLVGQTLASKLVSLGHQVKIGSRAANNEKGLDWVKKNGANASHGTFSDTAKFGEIVFNCTKGEAALEALNRAGRTNLKGKILIDVSNPLDFSKGMPPSLTVCNTDSLGEQIQNHFPDSKVVKTLNTVSSTVMVNPRMLPDSHILFLSGNDSEAKKKVQELLKSFGWKDDEFFDLGDITSSRGAEMILPLWVRIMGVMKSGAFNFKIIKQQ